MYFSFVKLLYGNGFIIYVEIGKTTSPVHTKIIFLFLLGNSTVSGVSNTSSSNAVFKAHRPKFALSEFQPLIPTGTYKKLYSGLPVASKLTLSETL